MIIFVDNEHEDAYQKPWGERIMAARTRIKYRLEDISGETCLIVRYNHMTPDLIKKYDVKAILVSGNSADPTDYAPAEQAGLQAVFRQKSVPTFCFCGGFEVMAETFGGRLDRIGPIPEGEPDPFPDYAAGLKKEFGYMPINVLEPHPFLKGLGEAPIMREAHTWEVKNVPDEFKLYGSTDMTPVQIIIHESLPIIGTQFHPEYYTDEHPAGKHMIENFFRVAGIIP
ncbi:MAG: gamma-glutamyl-gamma-aminobutyrate hydrolase family protein [Chloroflexota bacterium]